MLVATAGHIDHGKTALIRALTGVETDRLPEEKARGISIDLGFAYWRPADDIPLIGFVDVPGHERFVRNMLAGVSAVEVALLVVAADDGVMPQTIEHLRMLDLLGLTRGFIAITKCDRVTPDRIAAAQAEVAALIGATGLAASPLFAVSAMTGMGIAALRAALCAASRRGEAGGRADRNLRLAVDRAFSVTGSGTVVTGTVIDGVLEAGARLLVAPAGLPARVRGLQSAGRTVERVGGGERCAVNLAGVEVAQVARGDWLVEPGTLLPTDRIVALVTALASRAVLLRHQSTVHLHLATADVTARLLSPRGRSLPPGEATMVRVALDRPIIAVAGDRFILRDASGQQLLGGGVVLDPNPGAGRRNAAARQETASAFAHADPAAVLDALLAIPGHETDTAHFARSLNLRAATAQALYARAGAILLGRARTVALSPGRLALLRDAVTAALARHHAAHPEAAGATSHTLRQALPAPPSADLFAALLRLFAEERAVEFAGALIRLPGHAPRFAQAEQALWQRLVAWAEARGPLALAPADIGRELNIGEAAVNALLYRRRLSGDLWRVTERRFLLRDHLAALVETAATLATGADGFTAADYRDATGIGRNFVIQLLEHFDAIGVTRRTGEKRVMCADYRGVIGADEN